MVKSITQSGFVKTSIVDIYNSLIDPDNKTLDDLDLKGRDFVARSRLISKLHQQEIYGWLTSLEDNPILEICLFPAHSMTKYAKLIGWDDVLAEQYKWYNALHYISINPSPKFIRTVRDKPFATCTPYADEVKDDASWFGLTHTLGSLLI